jgi:hypothetical protein
MGSKKEWQLQVIDAELLQSARGIQHCLRGFIPCRSATSTKSFWLEIYAT